MTTCFRDRLPKDLCFALGQQSLIKALPNLKSLNPALYFVWQSTWAAQIFNPKGEADGTLALLQVGTRPPLMRVNAARVETHPENCQVIVSQFAVSSEHRHEVREAFDASGSRAISGLLMAPRIEPFMVYCRLSSGGVSVGPNRREIWAAGA
jgi:hypothetical protein